MALSEEQVLAFVSFVVEFVIAVAGDNVLLAPVVVMSVSFSAEGMEESVLLAKESKLSIPESSLQ